MTRYTLKRQPGFHRHRFDITGRVPNGTVRTCLDCGHRSQKIANRWCRLDPGQTPLDVRP